jgi:DNA-binding CsgD family transcriptional regulator
MLEKELISTHPDTKIDLSQLTYSAPNLVETFPHFAHIKDAKEFSYLATNANALNFWELETAEEMRGKTIFDLQKLKQKNHSNSSTALEKFAQTIYDKDEAIVRGGEIKYFDSPEGLFDHDGYVVTHPTIKIPLFKSDKKNKSVTAILTLVYDATRSTSIDRLYQKYQIAYEDSPKQCNQKFLEYIGLPPVTHALTSREIECLVVLSKYRSLKEAAKELKLSSKTLEAHLRNVRLKLNCQNLSNVLCHFTSPNRWKF